MPLASSLLPDIPSGQPLSLFQPRNTRNTRKKSVDPLRSSFRVFGVFRGSILSCWSSTTKEIFYHGILGTHGKREQALRSTGAAVCTGLFKPYFEIKLIQFVKSTACYSRFTISPPLRENRASQVSFGKSSFKLVTDPSNIAITVLPL